MGYHYSIKEGELLLNNCKENRILVQAAFLLRIFKILMLILSLLYHHIFDLSHIQRMHHGCHFE